MAVAELAFGLMLGLSRNIVPCNQVVRRAGTKDGLVGTELFGKTLGVVGTGKIGATVIRIALAFGMKVIAHSRTVKPELETLGVRFTSLPELMEESDIVTLHVPQNTSTSGMISRELIGRMKPGAILINTARGAGIDVFEAEPPIPEDHPLVKAPNALLTPHVAFATVEALERRAEIVFGNLKAWLAGTVQNSVC